MEHYFKCTRTQGCQYVELNTAPWRSTLASHSIHKVEGVYGFLISHFSEGSSEAIVHY